MPNQFFSPEGDLENYFVTDYWLIDQYIGDQLWAWGNGLRVQLGNNATGDRSTPVTTFAGGTNWKQVSCEANSTAAIKTDGTLWTWGYANNARLGNARITGSVSTPVTTFAGGNNWKQVDSGFAVAAIKTDGTLWIWGSATLGRLGNAATTGNISTPITTFAGGTNWKQVSSSDHVAAIKTDGTLWIWGNNAFGALGNASTVNVSTPVTTFLGGNNWKQVSTGNSNTIAIKTDGTLWTWGNASNGKLGNGVTTGNISTPITTFLGGTYWKSAQTLGSNSVAIKTDGTLWIWGSSGNGQLGNASTVTVSTPVTTFAGGTNWKQVSCGSLSMGAIKTDGTLWTWGRPFYGQLGNGNTVNSVSTPGTTFAGGTNWKQLSYSSSHAAAVQAGISAEYPLS